VFFRADAVSPQVADVVDKVMSQGLLTQQQEWKNKNYEETTNEQPLHLDKNPKQDVNGLPRRNSENYISSHYEPAHDESNREIKDEETWWQWQKERHINRDEEKTYSEDSYHKNEYSVHKDLERNGQVQDDVDEDEQEDEWNQKYNNSNLNSSFQDDDSNLSSSPFGGSHGNHSAYSQNSYDPERAPIGPNKEGVYFCHLCSFSGIVLVFITLK